MKDQVAKLLEGSKLQLRKLRVILLLGIKYYEISYLSGNYIRTIRIKCTGKHGKNPKDAAHLVRRIHHKEKFYDQSKH